MIEQDTSSRRADLVAQEAANKFLELEDKDKRFLSRFATGRFFVKKGKENYSLGEYFADGNEALVNRINKERFFLDVVCPELSTLGNMFFGITTSRMAESLFKMNPTSRAKFSKEEIEFYLEVGRKIRQVNNEVRQGRREVSFYNA